MNGKLKAVILIVVYLVVRFGLDSVWQQLPFWASYLFELFYVVGGYFWLGMKWKIGFSVKPILLGLFVGAFLSGLVIHEFAEFTELTIPIDFSDLLVLVLGLLVAPVLEELVFRGSLLESFMQVKNNALVAVMGTALLFSFGHGIAVLSVPPEFQSFVIYQTIYVFFLGLVCGVVRRAQDSILAPILVHFFFNFGFVLGQFYF